MLGVWLGGGAVGIALLFALAYCYSRSSPTPNKASDIQPTPEKAPAPADPVQEEPAEPKKDERIERFERMRDLVQRVLADASSNVQSMLAKTTAYGESLDQSREILVSASSADAVQKIEEILLRELDEMRGVTSQYREQLEEARQTIRAQEDLIQRMKEEAGHDALLQIPNRGSFDARITEELARASRYNSALCIVLIDVDYFKAVNDNYGHLTGDRVLQGVARVLHEQCRQHDFVARYGGEEFAFILPQTGLRQAKVMADRARRRIGSCRFVHNGTSVSVTCSAGLAQFRFGEDTVETLIARADKALYTCKGRGRNCVVVDEQDAAAFANEKGG